MKPALLAQKPRYPRSWDELPSGSELREIVEAHLTDATRQMFGYHLVKLGDLSSQLAIPACPIRHVVNVNSQQTEYTSIVSQSHELPFSENSVDAFILAHELDFAQDPHQILREVDRVLTPSGNVVIVGFNPLSISGLMKYTPIRPRQILHDARFFSSMRIKDWLNLLGFEVREVQHLVFSELFLARKISHPTRWQRWCEKYLSMFSSLYIISARKRELPLSIIKPRWKPKPNFAAVGASTRVSSQ